ncbi:MAG: polyprenyl synthetase family protein [Kiritimatiellae bacterium]|nr:polyprenyl synthetase family protein [Kiritimatiellia bacterium]
MNSSSIEDLAEEFAQAGGKRLRPRLCRALFDAAGGEGNLKPLENAIEYFHKASLIHDDIQDDAITRYGKPCMHRVAGIPLAVAAGDWLVAKGYTLIAQCDFPSAPEMLAAAAASHLALCEGQARELVAVASAGGQMQTANCDLQTVLSIYAQKTGEAFALAAELGAMAAGAGARIRDAAHSYGRNWGVAFQIADDMADGEGLLSTLAAKEECVRLRERFLKKADTSAAGFFELGEWWK